MSSAARQKDEREGFVSLSSVSVTVPSQHAVFECSVRILQVEKQNGAEFTLYQIKTTNKVDKTKVDRRFSEFCQLHNLLRELPGMGELLDPIFPPKGGFFSRHFERPERLSQRREGLQNYLQFVLGHPLSGSNKDLLKFLEWPAFPSSLVPSASPFLPRDPSRSRGRAISNIDLQTISDIAFSFFDRDRSGSLTQPPAEPPQVIP